LGNGIGHVQKSLPIGIDNGLRKTKMVDVVAVAARQRAGPHLQMNITIQGLFRENGDEKDSVTVTSQRQRPPAFFTVTLKDRSLRLIRHQIPPARRRLT
jgi:hypothetical protein